MARRYDPRVVGAFVLAAVALGVVAAVYLGAGRVLQHRVRFVVVFSEDLAGLEVDAPVKFRGVPVGRVSSIHLSMGSATDPLRELSMPVVIELNQTRFGCGGPLNQSAPFTCGQSQQFTFTKDIHPLDGTNYITRMSTGLELQVIMPVVNAPFRIYYAYNPMRMDTSVKPPDVLNRSLFPDGAAGDYSYAQAKLLYGSGYTLREPRKTFRFTVATTF